MSNYSSSDLLTLGQLARALPKPNGKQINPSTIYRWATRGIKGIRLQIVQIGSRTFTTMNYFDEFSRALAEAKTQTPPLGAPSVPGNASKSESTDEILRRAGIRGHSKKGAI